MFPSVALWACLAVIVSPALSQDINSTSIRGPTSKDWATLNSTVGNRLYQGTPWPKPCFSVFNGDKVQPDNGQCQFVQQNFFNNHLNRSQAFGAYSATQWETCMSDGSQCELDWMQPSNPSAFSPPARCEQGSVPSYYIDVRNKDDVIAALKFSKKQGIPLTIKNTGHDFQGRSSGKNTLSLWMHNIKYISHKADFIAETCNLRSTPPQSAVTLGAGQQFQEIYQFAHDNQLIIVGGSDQSVGAAGGWGQGGGHSSLSPAYGLGTDRTLQYKVVTPDGVYRTANACQNQDLFFALRGGGGGTFGIVLEVTMMASPATNFRIANINWPANNANLKKVLAVFLENVTRLSKEGWGGYLTFGVGNLVLTTNKVNLKAAQTSIKPLLDATSKLGGVSDVTEIATYSDWFHGYVQGTSGVQDAIGLPIALGSRLVPAKLHETASGRSQLLDALMSGVSSSSFQQMHITTPFGFTGGKNDTSVNPIWTSSLYQILYTNTWQFNATLADRQAAYAATTKAISAIRNLTPNSGAYHNEADIHEPNYQVSFWGGNYNRLLSIKNKYDPDHLLDCWHCVGWKGASDSRFKCYI